LISEIVDKTFVTEDEEEDPYVSFVFVCKFCLQIARSKYFCFTSYVLINIERKQQFVCLKKNKNRETEALILMKYHVL
jgi:hypothetical protein